jgi:hypothetical protein
MTQLPQLLDRSSCTFIFRGCDNKWMRRRSSCVGFFGGRARRWRGRPHSTQSFLWRSCSHKAVSPFSTSASIVMVKALLADFRKFQCRCDQPCTPRPHSTVPASPASSRQSDCLSKRFSMYAHAESDSSSSAAAAAASSSDLAACSSASPQHDSRCSHHSHTPGKTTLASRQTAS